MLAVYYCRGLFVHQLKKRSNERTYCDAVNKSPLEQQICSTSIPSLSEKPMPDLLVLVNLTNTEGWEGGR